MLPPRIRKEPKRATRWKSPAHRDFVRSHACCKCGSTAAIEFAHVRLGSGAGMGQKPDDWRGVGLCGGSAGCHARQHREGERTFWGDMSKAEALIEAFIKASPKRSEIERVRRERQGE